MIYANFIWSLPHSTADVKQNYCAELKSVFLKNIKREENGKQKRSNVFISSGDLLPSL